MLDELRRVPLLADLSEEDLERLYEMAETVSVPAGQLVLREGDTGDSLYIVLEGELEVTKRQGDREILLSSYRAGQFFGEMALLERAPRSASVRTLRESRLLAIDQTAFQALLSRSPSAPFNILRTVTSRLRSTESMLIQNEKMAALGTLAAGLAHELNNPASAIQRSVAQLRDALADLERSAAQIGSLAEEELGALRVEALTHGPATHSYDPLALSEREDELQGWLEDNGIGRPWELAPVLASSGWKWDEVERLAIRLSPEKLP